MKEVLNKLKNLLYILTAILFFLAGVVYSYGYYALAEVDVIIGAYSLLVLYITK